MKKVIISCMTIIILSITSCKNESIETISVEKNNHSSARINQIDSDLTPAQKQIDDLFSNLNYETAKQLSLNHTSFITLNESASIEPSESFEHMSINRMKYTIGKLYSLNAIEFVDFVKKTQTQSLMGMKESEEKKKAMADAPKVTRALKQVAEICQTKYNESALLVAMNPKTSEEFGKMLQIALQNEGVIIPSTAQSDCFGLNYIKIPMGFTTKSGPHLIFGQRNLTFQYNRCGFIWDGYDNGGQIYKVFPANAALLLYTSYYGGKLWTNNDSIWHDYVYLAAAGIINPLNTWWIKAKTY